MTAKKQTEKRPRATVIEAPPVGSTLWTVGQLSWVLQLSPSSCQRLAKEDPDFPKPLIVGRQQQRWLSTVVEAYIARCEAEVVA